MSLSIPKPGRKVKHDIDEEEANQSTHPTSKRSLNLENNGEASISDPLNPAGDSQPLQEDRYATVRRRRQTAVEQAQTYQRKRAHH